MHISRAAAVAYCRWRRKSALKSAMTENLARELPRLTRPSWPSFDQMQTAVR